MRDMNYYVNKLDVIPEELWCTNTYTKWEDGKTKHCVLGFAREWHTPELVEFMGLINAGLEEGDLDIANINDGKHPEYQQPTPKERVLAALKDIKCTTSTTT